MQISEFLLSIYRDRFFFAEKFTDKISFEVRKFPEYLISLLILNNVDGKPSRLRALCWGLVLPWCASVVARVRRALGHASRCALRPFSSPILRAAVESVRV